MTRHHNDCSTVAFRSQDGGDFPGRTCGGRIGGHVAVECACPRPVPWTHSELLAGRWASDPVACSSSRRTPFPAIVAARSVAQKDGRTSCRDDAGRKGTVQVALEARLFHRRGRIVYRTTGKGFPLTPGQLLRAPFVLLPSYATVPTTGTTSASNSNSKA